MARALKDRVASSSVSTGSTDLVLSTSPLVAHRTIQSQLSVGDIFSYLIVAVDANGVETGDWEIGLGTYSAANTLTRTTVRGSSNSNSAVNFSAGTKIVYLTASAADFQRMFAIGTGAPSGETGFGGYVRDEKPFAGAIYKDGVPLDNDYQWATRPAANATHEGLLIRITDLPGKPFFECVLYGSTFRWVPVNRMLRFADFPASPPVAASNGTTFVQLTSLALPGGLAFNSCRMRFSGYFKFDSGNASARICTIRHNNGNVISAIQLTSDVIELVNQQNVYVFADNAQRASRAGATDEDADGFGFGAGSSEGPSSTWDLTTTNTFQWGFSADAGVTTLNCRIRARELEIYYP